MADNSLGTGLYYAKGDYIGPGKRLLIWIIDLCVLGMALWIANVLWYSLPPTDSTDLPLSCRLVLFTYAYLTAVKASKLRTVGYRAVGAKVLTLKGERPSIWRMTFRLVLLLIVPMKLLGDLHLDRYR